MLGLFDQTRLFFAGYTPGQVWQLQHWYGSSEAETEYGEDSDNYTLTTRGGSETEAEIRVDDADDGDWEDVERVPDDEHRSTVAPGQPAAAEHDPRNMDSNADFEGDHPAAASVALEHTLDVNVSAMEPSETFCIGEGVLPMTPQNMASTMAGCPGAAPSNEAQDQNHNILPAANTYLCEMDPRYAMWDPPTLASLKAFADVASWIEGRASLRPPNVTWRKILHSDLERPKKKWGGPICLNIEHNVRHKVLDCGMVLATLTIPNTWVWNDAQSMTTCDTGATVKEATEKACKKMMIERLLLDAKVNYPNCKLRLVPNNWKVTADDLMRTINERVLRIIQPIVLGAAMGASSHPAAMTQPVLHEAGAHTHRRHVAGDEHYEPPAAHEEQERNVEIADLLVRISINEITAENAEGWANPANLKHLWTRNHDAWCHIQPWVELRRLVEPNTLRKFLLDRPHMFEVQTRQITGAHGLKLDLFRRLGHEVSSRTTLLASSEVLPPALQAPPGLGSSGDARSVVLLPALQALPGLGSSGDHLALNARSLNPQPAAQRAPAHDEWTAGVPDPPSYQAPGPQESGARDREVEHLLTSLSVSGGYSCQWVNPASFTADVHAELARLMRQQGTLWEFLLARPGHFQCRINELTLDSYRALQAPRQPAVHWPWQPAALDDTSRRATIAYEDDCTCGKCLQRHFALGWICPGPACHNLSRMRR